MRLWCSVDIFFLSLSFKTDTFFIILSFEEIRSSSCPYDARHVSTCFNLSPPPPSPSLQLFLPENSRFDNRNYDAMRHCVSIFLRLILPFLFHFCFLICCVIRLLSVRNTYVFSSIFIYILLSFVHYYSTK